MTDKLCMHKEEKGRRVGNGGCGGLAEPEKKLHLKNRVVPWVWCFFNSVHSSTVHTLGGRKLKPYKCQKIEPKPSRTVRNRIPRRKKTTGKYPKSDNKLHPKILRRTLTMQSHKNMFIMSSFSDQSYRICKETGNSDPYSGKRGSQ